MRLVIRSGRRFLDEVDILKYTHDKDLKHHVNPEDSGNVVTINHGNYIEVETDERRFPSGYFQDADGWPVQRSLSIVIPELDEILEVERALLMESTDYSARLAVEGVSKQTKSS